MGDDPSLSRSALFASEFTMDQGRGLGAINGPDIILKCLDESCSPVDKPSNEITRERV
jgi:hypothetical protein